MVTLPHLKSEFLLRSDITYLNFGSFGACPKPIFKDYQDWQLLLESEPCDFIAVNGVNYLKASREALAGYINCHPDDLVYVTNPTYAINIVARSLKLAPGDEILSTDIEYGAMDRTWNYYCNGAGAKYVRNQMTLPVTTKERFVQEFISGITPRTKAIFISQITSSTALRLPVEEICAIAKERGLLTIVDGAHVPGHIPLDLSQLQADIYTGACHKWMMAPKGCSFLHAKKEYQNLFDPIIISWGYQSAAPSHSRVLDYHQMQGTRDFSAFCTLPACIRFMKEHNWADVAAASRKMILDNYQRFCDLVGTQPICPVDNTFLVQMCSIPMPTDQPEKLHQLLFDKYRIEVPVMRQEKDVYLRFSINAFNSQADVDKLYDALTEIRNEGVLILRG